jgi:hypothetical protein
MDRPDSTWIWICIAVTSAAAVAPAIPEAYPPSLSRRPRRQR